MQLHFDKMEDKAFNEGQKDRVSVSKKLYLDLLAGRISDPLAKNGTTIEGLERVQWQALYRRAKHSQDCEALVRMMDAEPSLKSVAPALYLTAAMNIERAARRRATWKVWRHRMMAPVRWFTRGDPAVDGNASPSLSAEMIEAALADPLFVDEVARKALGIGAPKPVRKSPVRKPRSKQEVSGKDEVEESPTSESSSAVIGGQQQEARQEEAGGAAIQQLDLVSPKEHAEAVDSGGDRVRQYRSDKALRRLQRAERDALSEVGITPKRNAKG